MMNLSQIEGIKILYTDYSFENEFDVTDRRVINKCNGVNESRIVYRNSRTRSYEVVTRNGRKVMNTEVFMKHNDAVVNAQLAYRN